MSYHDEEWRSGTYQEMTAKDDSADSRYKYTKVEHIHLTARSSVWIAEREVPNSDVRELCVAKVTGIIEGETLSADFGEKFKLNDYLRQMKFVNHENLIKFYGFGKAPVENSQYRFVLICEYCPGKRFI